MKRKNFIFIILMLLAFFIMIYVFLNYQDENPKVCFKENCFEVEIALTEKEKSKGLMFREFLNEDKGMLFVYDKVGVYNFWMKNTLIPLDIIWINSNNEIIYIKENAPPCVIENCEIHSPNKNAKYVLEINGGISEKLNITIGDSVEFLDIF